MLAASLVDNFHFHLSPRLAYLISTCHCSCCLYFLGNHSLFLFIGIVGSCRGHGLLFQLFGLGFFAQIFVGGGSTCCYRSGGNISTTCQINSWGISLGNFDFSF